MKLLPLTVGCDPEGFIYNTKTKQFVSAHGIIPGTKAHPFPVKGGAVQVDGMAAEFNINPASTREEFIANIVSVKAELSKMLPEGCEMRWVPTATFSKEVWDAMPPEAKELGCDPDFNSYTKGINPRPDGDRDFRTGAGHVHLGWVDKLDVNDPGHLEACQMLATNLDFFLGVPSLLLDPDPTRRTMYGKAGCFRPKPYGVEYRTMSNTWVESEELMGWVFDNAQAAFNKLMEGEDLYDLYKEYARIVIDEDCAKGVSSTTAKEIRVVLKTVFNIIVPPREHHKVA